MTTTETFDQLIRLTHLYREILRTEDEKLSSYLDEDLDRVETLSQEEAALVEAVRTLHEEILQATGGEPLLASGEGKSRALLGHHLDELNGTIHELQLALHKSRRFVHHSLAHAQGLVAAFFDDHHRGYDGRGGIRAGQGTLRRGMRA